MSSATSFLSPNTTTLNSLIRIICPNLGFFLTFAGLKKLLTKWEAGEAVYLNNSFSTAEYRNLPIAELIGAPGLFFP
jgi:hypothetical protein